MPEGEVALALAELRSALEVGLAKIDGQLALLVQRSDQTDKAVDDLEQRVTSLENGRWPLPTIAVLASITAVGLTLYEALRGLAERSPAIGVLPDLSRGVEPTITDLALGARWARQPGALRPENWRRCSRPTDAAGLPARVRVRRAHS
ncbi:hypothetical protein [Streptomyces lunaelactis]|uniref:hypothetical protein n=2 Tax=Streptomyces lunaelactis TaxID=1535768 RepID=UPI0028166D42|nr:hypothetical protein [Streptomyces lunaelactis]